MQPLGSIEGRAATGVVPANNSCRLETRGKRLPAIAPAAGPGAPQDAGPSVVLAQMMAQAKRGCLHISVTPEDQICRTLCWISDRRGCA